MTKTKRTILITGATSGIGRHTALHLHDRGHRVFATGRNEAALAELADRGLEAFRMDVTDAESIAAAKRRICQLTDGEGVDVLVNNAGYGLFGPLEVLHEEDVRHQFDTNVFGLLAVTRAFIPQMREKGWGRIINVSSVGGRMSFPLAGAYTATKYAVESMSDALRMELAQFGIKVSLIEPGYIDTGFTSTTLSHLDRYDGSQTPYAEAFARAGDVERAIERFAASPKAVTRAIEKAIVHRRPRARYVAPWINGFGPWFATLMPTSWLDAIMRRVSGLSQPPARLPAGDVSVEALPEVAEPPRQHMRSI